MHLYAVLDLRRFNPFFLKTYPSLAIFVWLLSFSLILAFMASSSSSHHKQNAFSGIEPPNKPREVEVSSNLFDVFINHRGPDVKKTLATELYKSLMELGIRAFLDSEEKEFGGSFPSIIKNAISSASVHIAIFSKTYAESPWCLAELVLMLQSQVKLIPVLYQVEPWELRHIEKGVYAEAFRRYEEKGRYLDKIYEWKEALQQVSYTTGYDFKSSDYVDCKEIIVAVEKEVQRRKHLHVTKYPVGLHKLVKDFERRCLDYSVQDFESQRGTRKANVFGIFGMGGVGKTTLSKELFDKNKSKYKRASFLFDVREADIRGEIPSLQSKLLKDIFCEDHKFRSLEEGRRYLADRLERSSDLSFLIVLDDIDDVNQLDALLLMDILNKHGNNLVIITTRDVGLLIIAGIQTRYNLKGLDGEDARELFCWHAFGQPHPSEGYADLVEDFVNICGGLPLSLQVLGRHVNHRSQSYWQEELKKARMILPQDVKHILMISFDSLDSGVKQIFMDIACFFTDKSITTAMTIWKGSGCRCHYAVATLRDKCLIEENVNYLPSLEWEVKWKSRQDEFAFRMHDHLRDLGRKMADESRHPLRLWLPQDLKSLESKGFRNILAHTRGRCFHSFMDKSMNCQITYFIGERELFSLDASLLWLQLDYQNRPQLYVNSDIHQSIPPWIPLRNLLCLRISGGGFPRFWQNAVQLRELRISQCFGESSLPEELCDLQSLEHLQLTSCPMLSSLPPRFGDLRNLRYLDLSDCEQLEELPLSFEKLTCLKYIRLSCCCKLKLRFDMLENITQLEHLELTRCHELKELPRLVTPSLLQLRELRVNQCFQGSSLPEELCALQSLEHLELSGCPTLSSLPPHFGNLRNLRYLDLSNCEQLEVLPDSFYQLISLESIRLSYCGKLKLRLDMLKNITKLKYLDFTGCHLLGELPRLVPLLPLQLTELRITQCFGVSSLPEELCDLQSLEILELSCCRMLSSLPSRFGDLRNLRHLDLSCCWKLKLRLDMLENITMLEYLNLTRCHEVEELPHNISYQANLKRLFVEGTTIKFLPTNIGKLWNLEELKIGSPMLTSLPPSLGELTRLNTLVIDGCVQLQDLPPSLCNLDLLKQLTIRGSGLRKLPFGVGSSNIEVTGQQVEASNSGFDSRASVTENCRQTIWNAFKSITENCLKAIWNITEHGSPQTHVHNKIPAGVETLSLVANPQLMEIQVLPESLKNLEIYACGKLSKMSGVDHLLKLHRLEICSCPDLEELPSFAGLTSLQEFKIQGCPKLQIIQGLEFSKSLQILTAEVSLIRSLENAEELRRVELTSYTMSDLKSCILSMKKCPREAMIRAIVVSNIVQSLPLNNLRVLRLEEDSEWDNITQDLFNEPFLWYQEENVSDNEESGSSGSKVVQIAVCRGGSSAFPEYCVRRRIGSNTKEKQCKAVLARGDDENVAEAFNQLIRLLE